MNIRRFITLVLVIISISALTFAQEPSPKDNGGEPSPKSECADGIDNDKDGGIDNGARVPGPRGTIIGYPADDDCKKGAKCEDGTNKCVSATTNTSAPASGATDFNLQVRINNPLKVDTIEGAIQLFMNAVLRIALPFIVIFFIWSGLSFILARGNPEKIKTAKKMFWYTIIGTLLILGAWTITNAIIGTVNSITG